MSKIFLIPDSHSNHKSVIGLLKQERILNGAGKRTDFDTTVIHTGDITNAVLTSRSPDLKSLSLVEDGTIDLLLLGNHDAPYFNITSFNGFYSFPELQEYFTKLNEQGKVQIAYAVDNCLITHAGLTEGFADRFDLHDAKETAIVLNTFFKEGYRNHDLLRAVGYRRGGFGDGGVLWSDYHEPKYKGFGQIFGHTAGEEIRCNTGVGEGTLNGFPYMLHSSTSYCFDLGCQLQPESEKYRKTSHKIAGAWVDDEGIQFTTYVP